MMNLTDIFLSIFNVSITASILAFAVILVRLIFKKAPKSLTVVLWAMVAIRLICPFSVESKASLMPEQEFIRPETVYSGSQTQPGYSEIFSSVTSENPVDYEFTISGGSLQFSEITAPDGEHINPLLVISTVSSVVWAVGVAVMLLYALISYLKLRKTVGSSIELKDNVYICDSIKTPFILGVIKPKIYLPSDMDEETVSCVLAHERAHIVRRDHWWKPLGFILLAVYWFNPVMWLSYILLCRDIELACDEKVIKDMANGEKKRYSEALLSCSAPLRAVTACPVAFGEVGVKQRVKTVLNYKKPAFWVIAVALAASIAVGVCFMTDPIGKNGGEELYTSIYSVDEAVFPMTEIIEDGYKFTVTKTLAEDYRYEISENNGKSILKEFLQDVKISETANGAVDHSVELQYSGIINVESDKFDDVIIVFHDNFQKMYFQKGSEKYSIRSKDYTVLNCEMAREFFRKDEFTLTDSVWEFNAASSSSFHAWLTFSFDDIREIEKAEADFGRVSVEKGQKSVTWSPFFDEEYDEATVKVHAFRKDHSKVVFDISIKKIGQRNVFAEFYNIVPGEGITMDLKEYSKYSFSKPDTVNESDITKPQPVPGGDGITILDLDAGEFVTGGLLTDITSMRLLKNDSILLEADGEEEISALKDMLLSLRFDEDFYAHHSPEALSELTEYEISLNFSGSVMGDVIRLDKECKQMWFISESGGYTHSFVVLNGEILKNYFSQNTISAPDLDKAVTKAILSINSNKNWLGECPAEGHIIMGTDKKGDTVKAYVLEAFLSYGFDNGMFVEQGGHRTACVMTFLKTDEGYIFQDVEYTEDGSHLTDSVKRLFPLRYRKRAISPTQEDLESIKQQCRIYAQAYLDELGRTEKIGSYGDVYRISLTDLGVSVEVSNRILEQKGSTSYCHIGYYEELQDGVRYLCRTAYSETENIVVHIKEKYGTGQIAEKTVFDSLTGEIISDEQPVNMGYFDGKVLSVNENGKYAVVEPIKNSKMSKTAEKVYVSLDFASKVKTPDLYEGLYVSVFYEGSVATSGSKTVTMDGTSAIYLYADMNYKANPTLSANKQQHTTMAFIA